MTAIHEPMTAPVYLSRLRLNLRDRRVQRDLGNSQALHRRLIGAFPDATSRADARMLYRVEAGRPGQAPDCTILVQSAAEPDWSLLGAGYLQTEAAGFWPERDPIALKEVGASFARIAPGDRFRFRLRANPTQKRHFKAGEAARPTGPNGTRIPILEDAGLDAWIVRKGEQHGFRVLGARWQPDPVTGDQQRGSKSDGRALTHYAVLFDGALEVVDADAFQAALVDGIGPAKAYGFGLLSLAPMGASPP
ncbi:MAG TPA: type I-E CRISPR-associated protein Cas6/Cse3/CasE [Burkholderiales bacterium]|nr:type I-E CRISPR-associated protein Cas6/Cse3/CasE [Burkholderiales bacterium]